MSLQKELTAALKKLERERGLPFPPWRVTPQLEVVVQQTDEDEAEYPADFLEAECEGRSKKDRATAVREAAEGLGAMLDEPPGTVRFESSWSGQLSLLPRGLLAQLGKRLITRRVAPGITFDLALDDELSRWLEQRVGVKKVSTRTDDELLDAVMKWMRARVEVARLGKGAFVVKGHFAQVALLDLAKLKPPKLTGAPVALVHGFQVLFAGDQDPAALERIVAHALDTLGREHGPLVAEGKLLRWADGAWRAWLPPKEHPVRAQAVALVRRALETQYRQQEALLGCRDPDVAFAPVHQLTDGLTVSRWVEGRDALLPLTDAYTLVPREGDAVLLGGAALKKLLEGGLGALVVYDGDELLAPLRLTLSRFPTARELREAQPTPWQPDPRACWFM